MTGPLRRHHRHVDVRRRRDQAVADVEAVPEEDRVARLEVGGDGVGADEALLGVRGQDHDHVGPRGHLGGRADRQSLVGGLGARLRALLQAHAHLDARVAQRKRVGVALAAVADHRDLAALDDRQVGVVVVVDVDTHGFTPINGRGWR